MKHVVKLVDGYYVYDGLLSSREKASIDEILNALRVEIPDIEFNLEKKYGKSVWYKYHLGIMLGKLLEKYDISISERRIFWDEIKNLASKNERKRDEGSRSVTRSFYQQCYILSQQDTETIEKLTWRQWQSLLDRVGIRDDKRIFVWLKNCTDKIREDDWREFQKALHLYLKGKDTSVFETEELFSIYSSILFMCRKWRELFKAFSSDHPKSMKIKKESIWAKKYYLTCYIKKKEKRSKVVTEEICNESFSELMY